MSLKSKKPKLLVELIPTTCHFSNVRTTVSSKDWDKIRFISYAAANNKCQICGGTGKKQGYKHDVECHEIWQYDDVNHIQKLVGLISLCPTCHQVKHIGRAIAIGKQKECYRQLAKVNEWSLDEINAHIQESFDLHKERSKYQWELDLSILSAEPYSLQIITGEKRIFEVKRYKKKRRRKRKAKKKPLGKRPKRT